jgi:hypothetical protein
VRQTPNDWFARSGPVRGSARVAWQSEQSFSQHDAQYLVRAAGNLDLGDWAYDGCSRGTPSAAPKSAIHISD